MNIITISREFGSGGRELGKRLADQLGYAYYDREIEEGIAEKMDMDVNYVARFMERGSLTNIPLHFGRTLSGDYSLKQRVNMLLEQQRLLKEIAATSHCVIVGRAADVILAEHQPFKIFVYADMAYKVERCLNYAETGENLSAREMERAIQKIDSQRARYHQTFSDMRWGDKRQYHLCVNTGGLSVQEMIPILAQYTEYWFRQRQS